MKRALLILTIALPLVAHDRDKDEQVTPEPASFGIAALGLACVSLAAWRKRQK